MPKSIFKSRHRLLPLHGADSSLCLCLSHSLTHSLPLFRFYTRTKRSKDRGDRLRIYHEYRKFLSFLFLSISFSSVQCLISYGISVFGSSLSLFLFVSHSTQSVIDSSYSLFLFCTEPYFLSLSTVWRCSETFGRVSKFAEQQKRLKPNSPFTRRALPFSLYPFLVSIRLSYFFLYYIYYRAKTTATITSYT